MAATGEIKGNLHLALDPSEQTLLMKQCSSFAAIPRLGDTEGHLSKSDKIREWKMQVELHIAALHPLFAEHWQWS